MNSFGRILRITIFGESHGKGVGIVLDGVPAGIPLSDSDFKSDLGRRRAGSKGTTQRLESDIPNVVSGLYNGYTTGSPLTIFFENADRISEDYRDFVAHPRPSHADFVAQHKYSGFNDPRGGGHFSGRLTVGLVAAGVVAKKIIEGVSLQSRIIEMGGEQNHERFPDVVSDAMERQDSIGGIIECRAAGVPIGLGEPYFDTLDGVLGHVLFSIPAVKGVEFGTGFKSAVLSGSQNNDVFIDREGKTQTNNSGGIVGGISNGNELIVRVAVKPTASIGRAQETFNMETQQMDELKIGGRHDTAIVLRMPVVVEAAVALVLADFFLLDKTSSK